MIRYFKNILLFAVIAAAASAHGKKDHSWREDFLKSQAKTDKKVPEGWALKATKFGVPATVFKVDENGKLPDGVLKVVAKKATGGLMCNPSVKVDLKKTPILRWRWRVNKLPKGADGRKSGKDDQALAIYVGASDWLKKKTIAYRWETETPKGTIGNSSYGGGIVKVKWFCLRNKESGTGKWYVEQRNIAQDFQKAFGFIPKEFALSVCANSQYTKSESQAEVDYIEFVPAESVSTKLAQRSDK
jgi:hypothetical protein